MTHKTGQGESGKSTVFKQMKIIQAREDGAEFGFPIEERMAAKSSIYDNIFTQMKVLIGVAFEEDMEFSIEDNKVVNLSW